MKLLGPALSEGGRAGPLPAAPNGGHDRKTTLHDCAPGAERQLAQQPVQQDQKPINWLDVTYDLVVGLSQRLGAVYVDDDVEVLENVVCAATETWMSLGVIGVDDGRILSASTENGMLEVGGNDIMEVGGDVLRGGERRRF